MSIQAWYASLVIVLVMGTLATNRVAVDVAMVGGVTLLLLGDALLGNVLDLTTALHAFANPALVLIGSLFVVAAGLTETGAIWSLARRLLGMPTNTAAAQLRLMVPVALLSGFMNNTPIVAMYLPIVQDWAKRLRMSPSKLYMPLSFSAILGGKLTLIGTASNVVVMTLYVEWLETSASPSELERLTISPLEQFWGIGLLGVPTAFIGIGMIVALSRWLLPARRPPEERTGRHYQVRVRVAERSPVAGRTIEAAGLRQLPGLFLTRVQRNGDTQVATPDTILKAGDLLLFAGVLESVVDLRKIDGLVPLTDGKEEDDPPVSGRDLANRILIEAVVARGSALEGRTPKEASFRARHNAAIIAIHRDGVDLSGKLGDITLRAGDSLLIETNPSFTSAIRASKDFYLASSVENSRRLRHEKKPWALGILALLIFLLTVSPLPPAVAALTCAGLMVLSRCLPSSIARDSVRWPVLLVIGSALCMGAAMERTGAASVITSAFLTLSEGASLPLLLFVLFLVTAIASQLITNNGAAVLMFPLTMKVASQFDGSPHAFLYILMIGAGSSFISPVAYQTNLMVYGPGGYHFSDFVRLGFPLTIAIGAVAALLAPFVS